MQQNKSAQNTLRVLNGEQRHTLAYSHQSLLPCRVQNIITGDTIFNKCNAIVFAKLYLKLHDVRYNDGSGDRAREATRQSQVHYTTNAGQIHA